HHRARESAQRKERRDSALIARSGEAGIVKQPDEQLPGYYAARAAEYERIYEKPERQRDLARLRELIPAYFAGRDVLDVACGTGYWTQWIAPGARRVTAIDINVETL